jgi:glycosyltransferase involved in cell wall biosynthesis
MKIAILTPLFPPKHLGGLEIAAYNIARHLAERHEVHIVTALDECLPKKELMDGFSVHRFRTSTLPILRTISYYIKSFFVVKSIDPDIVHIQTVFLSLSGLLIKKLLHKPYIIYARGSDVYLRRWLEDLISKPILKNADAVITLTEDMKSSVRKTCDRDILVIPNGINLSKFENLSKSFIRSEFGIEDEKIILFVGSLRPVKGVEYLIEAMSFLINKNTKLLLVGDGEKRRSLESLAKNFSLSNNVVFVGKVANDAIPKYMAAADILVLPSLSEGFPNTLLEAMASGLPIIATNITGIHEIVKDGENGFLVEPKNPEDIADRITKLLDDAPLREIISHNNKEKSKQFSWSHIVDIIESVYMNVLRIN